MTEPLNPDYCVTCHRCDAQFEMVWGRDNDLCEKCAKNMEHVNETRIPDWTEMAAVRVGSESVTVSELIRIVEFYANPENWRRFPIEDGVDANGSPVQQYWWIGDGGEFARGENLK